MYRVTLLGSDDQALIDILLREKMKTLRLSGLESFLEV